MLLLLWLAAAHAAPTALHTLGEGARASVQARFDGTIVQPSGVYWAYGRTYTWTEVTSSPGDALLRVEQRGLTRTRAAASPDVPSLAIQPFIDDVAALLGGFTVGADGTIAVDGASALRAQVDRVVAEVMPTLSPANQAQLQAMFPAIDAVFSDRGLQAAVADRVSAWQLVDGIDLTVGAQTTEPITVAVPGGGHVNGQLVRRVEEDLACPAPASGRCWRIRATQVVAPGELQAALAAGGELREIGVVEAWTELIARQDDHRPLQVTQHRKLPGELDANRVYTWVW